MPHLHLTDFKLQSLAKNPPQKSKQIDYFDDAAKGGVRGLMLKHSYGGTLTFFVMYYEGGKSKLWKLGKYPVLKLAAARQPQRSSVSSCANLQRRRESVA